MLWHLICGIKELGHVEVSEVVLEVGCELTRVSACPQAGSSRERYWERVV